MRPRFSLASQLFSECLYWDSADRSHTVGNQLGSHKYGSEIIGDLHFLSSLCVLLKNRDRVLIEMTTFV